MIELTLSTRQIRIDPFPKGMSRLLTNIRSVPVKSNSYGWGGLNYEEQQEPLFWELSGSTAALTFSGFLNRIVTYLKRNNLKYKIIDKRGTLPEVDFSRIKGDTFRFAQKEALAAILSSYGGLIKLPTANGKTQIIGYLAKLYKGVQKMLVISESSAVLTTIKERIESLSTSYVHKLDKDSDMSYKADVIVCSSRSLHKLDMAWPDIVLYDEAHSAAAPQTSRDLALIEKARMFGLTATPEGRSDNSELIIEGLIGPCIINVSYEASQKAGAVCPIRVYMVPVECDDIQPKNKNLNDKIGIWRNRIRNGTIAKIVNSIPDEEQILIITNTAEHVFRICKNIPGAVPVHGGLNDSRWNQFIRWKLVDPEKTEHRNPDIDKIEKDFREGKVRCAVATHTWKEGVDFPKLAYVIRADGKRGAIPSIQIGGRLSRINHKKLGILIDFYDDFGQTFVGRTKDRIKFYKHEGWEVNIGIPDFYSLQSEVGRLDKQSNSKEV